MKRVDFGEVDIYPVVDRARYRGRYSDEEALKALRAGGARIVQLRHKESSSDREFYELAVLFRAISSELGMALIVNDRVDIAMMVRADGAHLGANDAPIEAARALVGRDFILGASSRSLKEAYVARDKGADYVNVGPIFATSSKPDVAPIGPGRLKEALDAKLGIPISAMGAIDLENIDELLDLGLERVGVIGAIFDQRDIEEATRRLKDKILAKQGSAR